MVWDPQRQQALKMDGIIIIVIVGKVIIKKNKIGLVTPTLGSPEVDQGLIKGLRIRVKYRTQSSYHSQLSLW
jgi:hypothetical protein